ncbi:MAG: hypothetical protein PHI63_00745 [Patescibacteria group bacterium]|nr:hypothetical protein [Patescibacteria group bacterium]
MPRLQRIVFIVTFIMVAFTLGLLLYAVFFAPETGPGGGVNVNYSGGGGGIEVPPLGGINGRLPGGQPTPTAAVSPTPAGTPVSPVANGGLTHTQQIGDRTGQGFTLDHDGSSLLYYNGDDGIFYRLTSDGKATRLSDHVFHDVQQVTWSDDRQRAVLEYPDGQNIIYDFGTSKQVTLPKHWESFDFSPDGTQVVAKSIGLDVDNRWLVMTDMNGNQTRPIASIGQNADAITPSWSPNNQMVATLTENQGSDSSDLIFIGLNNENYPSLTLPGLGYEGQWTPSGNQLLYSVHSGRSNSKPELWIVDATASTMGSNRREIGLQTWSHKCTFDSTTTAYCAVPSTLQDGAGLFPQEMDNSADQLYRVDLATGATSLVATPDEQHTMQSLQVSSDGRTLYYVAKQDGKAYKIQLK